MIAEVCAAHGIDPDQRGWTAARPRTTAEVCAAHGIDPDQRGWTAARPRTTVERWQPTPELVHGVTVNHPELAQWLKRCGVFSGKAVRFRPTQ